MTPDSSKLDHATLQQAADWFARLQECPDDLSLRQQWQIWLDEDGTRQLAWHYIEGVSQRFNHLQPQRQLADQALSGLRRNAHSRRRVLGVIAGGVLVGGLGWHLRWPQSGAALFADYRTAVGEIRHLQLADGTQLWLNSDSAMDVRIDAMARRLTLIRGEVLIETAADTRPFALHTPTGTLVPLGTRFSVRLSEPQTWLNVYQGAVQATCASSQRSSIVQAGQRMAFDRNQPAAISDAKLQHEAWSRGLLLAEDMRLGEFVDELGRYRRGHLGLHDSLRELRVMGSFSLHDTDKALTQLTEILPLRISQPLPWWTTIEPR